MPFPPVYARALRCALLLACLLVAGGVRAQQPLTAPHTQRQAQAVRASAKAQQLRLRATYRTSNRVAVAPRAARLSRGHARPLRDASWWMRRLDAPNERAPVHAGPVIVLRSQETIPIDAVAFAGGRVIARVGGDRRALQAADIAAVLLRDPPAASLPPAIAGGIPGTLLLRDGARLVGWLLANECDDETLTWLHPVLGRTRHARADAVAVRFDAGWTPTEFDSDVDIVELANGDELHGGAVFDGPGVVVFAARDPLGVPLTRVRGIRFASVSPRDAHAKGVLVHLADGSVLRAESIESLDQPSLRLAFADGSHVSVGAASVVAVSSPGVRTAALAGAQPEALRLRESGASRLTLPGGAVAMRGAVRLPENAGAWADARVTIWVDGVARFFARLTDDDPWAPFSLPLPRGAEVMVTLQPGRAGPANAVADVSATLVLAQD